MGDYDYGNEFKQKEVLRQFKMGLPTGLRTKCMEQQGPKTLKDALTITIHLEFAQQFQDMQNTESSELNTFQDFQMNPMRCLNWCKWYPICD